MCDFCEALKDKNKEIILDMRTTYADDNICEYVNDEFCSLCKGCDSHFEISPHVFESGEIGVGVDYIQRIWDKDNNCVQILPTSELMIWNYCPYCGKQLSEKITNYDFKRERSVIKIKEVEN